MDLATFQHILLAIKALPGKGKKKTKHELFFYSKAQEFKKTSVEKGLIKYSI